MENIEIINDMVETRSEFDMRNNLKLDYPFATKTAS